MSRKKKINIKNWKVILLSFIVAATFWFFKALNKSNYTATINYPIAFIYNTDSVIVTKPLPRHVKLDVSGGGWNLLRKTVTLSADPVKIRLSNPTEIKSITRVSLLPEVVNQLKNISINRIITDTLHVSIEKLTNKKVKIYLDTTSYKIENGYVAIGEPTFSPDSVILTGPVSMLNRIDSQYISLDDSEIDGSVNTNVDVVTLDKALITSNVEEVKLIMPIDELVDRTIAIPVKMRNPAPLINTGTYIHPDDTIVELTFQVPNYLKDSVLAEDFSVFIALNQNNYLDSVAKVDIEKIPGNVYSLKVNPDFLRLERSE